MNLSTEQLQQLRVATGYSYEAGDIPEDSPQWLREYTVGDGGYLHLLDQSIAMSKQIDAVDMITRELTALHDAGGNISNDAYAIIQALGEILGR